MEPVLVYNLLQSIDIMTNALQSFNDFCLKDIAANVVLLKEYVESSIGIITAINPHLGYEATSKIAKEAIETGKSVRLICLEHGVLTEEEHDLILNPNGMTELGISGSDLVIKKA